ncbi:hypothetical protein J4234_06395 [Candidatus Woesearchaeota archaeon]|nr:hypothetical protein [Candidatus Woesearchaeota archaeon]
MDIYKYLMFAKDFILDRQFLNLLISTFILFLASLLAWYIYYKQLARRDLFDIPKLNLKMKFVSIVDRMVYILKYLFIFPVYSFMWFLLFSFLLFALSKSRPIEDILFLGIIVVAATRIGAYVSEKLAEDMAKLLPLTLIAIFLMDPKAVTLETIKSSVPVLLEQIPRVAKYLLFIIAVEWLLRIGRWVITSIKTTKQ